MDNKSIKSRFVLRIKRPAFEDFAVVYFSLTYIITIVNNTIRLFVGNTYKLDTALIYTLFIVLLMTVLEEALRRIRVWQIIGLIAVICSTLLSMLFSSEPAVNWQVLQDILLECVPMFICGACIYDFGKVRHGLIRMMTVVPYCYFLMRVFEFSMFNMERSYSQYGSYSMLLISVVLTSALFENFSVKYLIPLVISMFFMIAYGARGPLVCWLLFILLLIIVRLVHEDNNIKKIYIIAVISALIGIVYKSFYSILSQLLIWFSELGFSVRIVNRLLDENFMEDAGRNSISEICLERIGDNPFIGTGIVNDRIYIASRLGVTDAIGEYPHNVFLEFLMQYGMLVGIVLIVLMVWVLFKSYRVASDKQTKDFIGILVGTYMFPLMFSESYINAPGFYLLVGVCIATIVKKKNAVALEVNDQEG